MSGKKKDYFSWKAFIMPSLIRFSYQVHQTENIPLVSYTYICVRFITLLAFWNKVDETKKI